LLRHPPHTNDRQRERVGMDSGRGFLIGVTIKLVLLMIDYYHARRW
jgi:hypothetical protein